MKTVSTFESSFFITWKKISLLHVKETVSNETVKAFRDIFLRWDKRLLDIGYCLFESMLYVPVYIFEVESSGTFLGNYCCWKIFKFLTPVAKWSKIIFVRFSRRHYGKHSCEITSILDQMYFFVWFDSLRPINQILFKDISIFSSCGHFVQQRGTIVQFW